jgi:hypothetical protein
VSSLFQSPVIKRFLDGCSRTEPDSRIFDLRVARFSPGGFSVTFHRHVESSEIPQVDLPTISPLVRDHLDQGLFVIECACGLGLVADVKHDS